MLQLARQPILQSSRALRPWRAQVPCHPREISTAAHHHKLRRIPQTTFTIQNHRNARPYRRPHLAFNWRQTILRRCRDEQLSEHQASHHLDRELAAIQAIMANDSRSRPQNNLSRTRQAFPHKRFKKVLARTR